MLDEAWAAQLRANIPGLLSVAELVALARLIEKAPPRVLEVGHLYGLSTAAIIAALSSRPDPKEFVSYDAHIEDKWIREPAPLGACLKNLAPLPPFVTLRHEISQNLVAPIDFPVVFYDGDHEDEQLRFTEAVIASPAVKLFIFDDADFDIPSVCCQLLAKARWLDLSPSVLRLNGDKGNPNTMTLGIFKRED